MEKDYESIKSKLKKLLALAEGGVGGEAHNARILLEKLCDEYGISLEDLLDTEKKFGIGLRLAHGKYSNPCSFSATAM